MERNDERKKRKESEIKEQENKKNMEAKTRMAEK
jgi:hypothetical protein